ncbi:antibiotic biosynthesis monooxygenase family protein [Streptomyces hokutonensis]|uniref:antibiotic biosynthesis monooxygenase family protein n=1 Tax=Streptomyces hokutonensis TaxID=1306990 RepID=UPI0038131AD5
MIDLRNIDAAEPFLEQLQGEDNGPITLVNTFVVPEGEMQAVLDLWREDSFIMKAKRGFISAQLHRGLGDSNILTNVAVWESVSALRDAFSSEEFQSLLPKYPDGSYCYPHVVRKVAVEGVCVA